ncbi:MAG TPA: S41 family peptidase [Candidatus Paceibacterota bacterium]|nr:S41 family peptidase [Candidatus Paceibacterota bacterium]
MSRWFKITLIAFVFLSLLGGTFVLGFYLGGQKQPAIEKITSIINKEKTEVVAATDFEPFWKVWQILDKKHPKAALVDDEERVFGAIQGLAGSLKDPYTVFFPPDESKAFAENINGEFGGIGIEIGFKDGALTVIAPLKDSPAEKAGLRSGDHILKINKTTTENMSIDRAVSLIRGEKGTTVVLTIIREDEKEPRDFSIIRDTINVPVLETEKKNDIFIIRLFNFSSNSPELFRKSLMEFSKAKTNKLILDLRGNPGGFLEASIDIASWFLPAGKPVVIEKIGETGQEKIHRSKGYAVFSDNLKMIILVDGGSASASEILAGALSEHGVARLVGGKTYGKGSVQELIDITDNTSLKVTIAEWLTPNKVEISGNGLTPDVLIKITKEDVAKDRDPQLQKALELLK